MNNTFYDVCLKHTTRSTAIFSCHYIIMLQIYHNILTITWAHGLYLNFK